MPSDLRNATFLLTPAALLRALRGLDPDGRPGEGLQ